MRDILDRIKYMDEALRKKIILGGLAGVLFIVALGMLARAFMGGPVPTVDDETRSAARELSEKLASDDKQEQVVEDYDEPFKRRAQEQP